tara:strand:- start:105 stop:266 length:162 start_codon:yes stop_codon:yes gene_type:complete
MATRVHSNRIEIGTLTTSQRNSLSGVQEGTIAFVIGVGVQVYNGNSWLTWVSV